MYEKNNKVEREYGLDLLRSLSMVFVIALHLITHGGMGDLFPMESVAGILVELIKLAVYPAVNCFVLLSGYLLCALPFRVERIVKIWLTAMFWSLIIQCVFFLKNPASISIGTVIYMFLPILSGRYWFLNAYIVLMLCSPVLNQLLRDLPKWKLRGLLLVSTLIFSVAPIFALGADVFQTQNGYGFSWFLVLYLWGAFIRMYTPKLTLKQSRYALLGYAVLVGGHLLWIRLTGILSDRVALFGQVSGLFLRYTSIPVFGSALCLLLFFRSKRFSDAKHLAAFFGRLSALVFAVYLIHDHPLIRETVIRNVFIGWQTSAWYLTLLYAAGIVVIIFLACVAAEWLRVRLFRILRLDSAAARICRKLEKHIVFLLTR